MAATIEDLPPEIMGLILKKLKRKDYNNCLKTSIRWRELTVHYCLNSYLKKIAKHDEDLKNTLLEEGWIENSDGNAIDLILALYKKFESYTPRVLIITGKPFNIEIIDLVNPKIKNELPTTIVPKCWGSVGGLIQEKLIICGGFQATHQLFVIGQLSKNMLKHRVSASSVVLNTSTLWVVGGRDDDYNDLSSTELITLDQPPAKGPKLPFKVYSHGMVKYNDNAIYIIGGWQNGSESKDTWILDPSNGFRVKKGPSLKEARIGFSCGKMLFQGKLILVVAGGFVSNSVEILDPSSNQGWTYGIVTYNHSMQ